MSLLSYLKSKIFPETKPIRYVSRLPDVSELPPIHENNILRREQERQERLNVVFDQTMEKITERVRAAIYNHVVVFVPNVIEDRVRNAVERKGYTVTVMNHTSPERTLWKITWKHKL